MYLPTVIADVLTAVVAGGLGEQDLTTIRLKEVWADERHDSYQIRVL